MKRLSHSMFFTLLFGLALFGFAPTFAQGQASDLPSQFDLALGALSQGLRENLTIEDLSRLEWSQQDFSDTSLGCPQPGQSYAQVITPGYQFLLSYAGTTYDYRVSENGENVVLCDTRPAEPVEPTPPAEPPTSTCNEYVVERGDSLAEIARECNTTLSAILAANPDIPDPDLIYPGQTIDIPGGGRQRSVTIRPDSGPPGTTIRVFASGFPSGAQVQIGLGPPESEYTVVATREMGADGELVASVQIPASIQAPDERVAVVAYNFEETVSEVFSVTEGQAPPVITPTEPNDGLFEQTQIYLVALGDNGQSGQSMGCGDSLIPVTVHFEPTSAPLTAALDELFAINSRTYGQSGLYNALYQSDLAVEGIDIVNREAIINLSGTLQIGGVCDEPRVTAQIEQTALQYSTIDTVTVNLNGAPLEQAF